MSEKRKIVERFWAAMEKNRLDEADAVVAADCHFQMPGVALSGLAQMKPLLAAYVAAFPDMRHEVKRVVEQDDAITLELVVRGTHRGPMMTPQGSIPATGKEIVWDSCDCVRIANGKIVSWHAYYDNSGFLTALGLLRPAA